MTVRSFVVSLVMMISPAASAQELDVLNSDAALNLIFPLVTIVPQATIENQHVTKAYRYLEQEWGGFNEIIALFYPKYGWRIHWRMGRSWKDSTTGSEFISGMDKERQEEFGRWITIADRPSLWEMVKPKGYEIMDDGLTVVAAKYSDGRTTYGVFKGSGEAYPAGDFGMLGKQSRKIWEILEKANKEK